jgi:hypothetical protein
MGTIECLSQYAGKVDPPTARRAGLLAPRFTLAEAICIADHLARVTAERDAALAEVEAMRAVVDVAIRAVSASSEQMRAIIIDDDMVDALDDLHARKGGG